MRLHCNGVNGYLFVNGTEIHTFTAKDSVVVPNNLCLGIFSKDFSASNMKKTGFNGWIDYNSIDVEDIKFVERNLIRMCFNKQSRI